MAGTGDDAPSIHPTADVAPGAAVGRRSRLWHQVQLMEGASIGDECVVGKGAFIGAGTTIGDRVKIGNYANLFGATIGDDVQIGPLACVMEDPRPRAVNPDGSPKRSGDFQRLPACVHRGASLGAGALILPGVTVGRFAMVAAGAVVNRDVADHGTVVGNPARQVGWVCICGDRLDDRFACGCGRVFPELGDGALAE